MNYKKIEPFVRDYGVRKSFFCEYFKKQEKKGKSKKDIQAEAIKNEIVKSPRVLDYTYDFYETHKDLIGWI